MKPIQIFYTLGLFCIPVSGLGCTAFESVFYKAKHQQDLAEIRRDTREELAEIRKEQAELDTEAQRREAEFEAMKRRYEREFCAANQEALKRNVKSNIKETIESKLAFNFSQNLEVGELEVDEEALKKVLEDREKEAQRAPPQEPQRKICGCDDRPCGCDGGLIKKHCLRCRHKLCGCKPEPGCGGPEALRQVAQEPLRQPLRPTEIPLKLPVRIAFGLGNPEIEETGIRREPLRRDNEPVRKPCDGNRCACDACQLNRLAGGSSGSNKYVADQPITDIGVPQSEVGKLLTSKKNTDAEEPPVPSDLPKPIPDKD